MSGIKLPEIVKIFIVILIIVYIAYVLINLPKTGENKKALFPGIIGDSILRDNESGIIFIKGIVAYDNFSGNILQGYRANYSGVNGSMIIFVAQMLDNISAEKSFTNMIVKNGYDGDEKRYLNVTENTTIVKLPVKFPEVFAIRMNGTMPWHYTFAKLNKVYWIGFYSQDIQYHANMLEEVYRTVDLQG